MKRAVVLFLVLLCFVGCELPTGGDTSPETRSVTVYVTKTGDKYHSSGCRYLSKSRISIDLDVAKSRGYSACSVCNPPR